MSPVAVGDRELLARVLAETGARTALPEPSWTEYLGNVLGTGIDWLFGRLRRVGSLLNLPHEVITALAWLILALVGVLLVVALARAVRRRRPAPEQPAHTRAQAIAAPVPLESWAAELDRRLGAGQARAALEALWWWLARSLMGAAVEPAWTTRELLVEARRSDLGALGRTLDRLLYAAAEPQPGDVRALFADLREALR